MSVVQIRHHLESILSYMQPYWGLVNCHMVNYLTHNHWERFVPPLLRAEVADSKQKVNQCIEAMFWFKNKKHLNTKDFPEFGEFLKECEKYRLANLKDVIFTPDELRTLYGIMSHDPNAKISIKEFMKEKKRHEVELVAELVNDIISLLRSKDENVEMIVVDAGDGIGYLSSRLALQYNQKVLGIDFNEDNTKNAIERHRKLQRAWKSLTERAALENLGINSARRKKEIKEDKQHCFNARVDSSLDNYKTTSKFITTDLDFVRLINEHFPNTSTASEKLQFCLTGLHTCGNLASTSLKVFSKQTNFKVLCNIGCCYHLLNEQFSGQEFFSNQSIREEQPEPGFPMSRFMKEKRVQLGRNARMLASQSIERTLAAQELPNISVYYRALLEIILLEEGESVKLGKVRNFNNFEDYLEICKRKKQPSLRNIDSERVEQLKKQYVVDEHYLNLFYLLRMTFSPVLESLILLDRLLYLQELNYNQSFLISLFDPVISPRHFCILALKS